MTYPLLIAAFAGAARKAFPTFPDNNYPDEVKRDGFQHLPLLSYCRTQAQAAIREAGGLADITREEASMIRWRASVPYDFRAGSYYDSRLELFMDDEDKTKPMRLVYSAPICGDEFAALPLVLKLGIELLIRKECNGADPE